MGFWGFGAVLKKPFAILEKYFQNQPSLEQMARLVNLSPFHFQRLFQRWADESQAIRPILNGPARETTAFGIPKRDGGGL